MAVAVPKRRAAPAPPPARTSPPKRKAPQRKAGAAAPAAPQRRKKAAPSAPARRKKAASPRGSAVAAPARTAPARRAPARAPQRARPKTRRNPGARVIPLAGRTAVAVRQLPDSGLMVRMTRGRAWIGVLGLLLAGIVALNVVTLSFAATAGKIDAQITTLEGENGLLANRAATKGGIGRVRGAGSEIGLAMPSSESIRFVEVNRDTIATAAARLAAASPSP
jgi:hypothetical protein